MLPGLFDFLHRILPFLRRLNLGSGHRHNLDSRKITLEIGVEGEAVCLCDLTTFGIFEEDFEFSTGEGL